MTAASPEFGARRPLALGFATLAALGGGLFGWGTLASISGAVIAVGQVEVESRDQVVEHLHGGTVAEILAGDGDRVAAGQALLRLDGEELRAEAALLEAEHVDLAARRSRLEAELADADDVTWDPALARRAATDPAAAAVLEGQLRLFRARSESRAGLEAQLRERIGQTTNQVAGLEAQAEAVRRQAGFVARELDVQRSLFGKGLTELSRLLAVEREAASLDGQAGDIAARIAGARGRMAEIEIQILRIGAERVEEAAERAREVRAREGQVVERLTELRRRLGAMAVAAPVAGEVFGMRVSTVGEVVRPGEPILRIVPDGANLVVRARLEPIHVDQAGPGQDAVLRFSAFTARTTPEYAGRVVRVSADAQPDERTGLSWYEVELAIGAAIEADPETGIGSWPGRAARSAAALLPEDAQAWLQANAPVPFAGRPARRADAAAGPAGSGGLALAPGMPVEVHLRTGERSPLSYLAKPLTDWFARSLREE